MDLSMSSIDSKAHSVTPEDVATPSCYRPKTEISCSQVYSPISSDDEEMTMEDMKTKIMEDSTMAQIAKSGPDGFAVALAAVSKRKREDTTPLVFETDPVKRKRQANSMLRKIDKQLKEFTEKFALIDGLQTSVIIFNPKKSSCEINGTKPLTDILKKMGDRIVREFRKVIHAQCPPVEKNMSLYQLPQLLVDGIPTDLKDMTQAQLRKLIPLMLKYSTGRGKPGWGKESLKPVWWPENVPWANVRVDERTPEERLRVPWTQALRLIVKECYTYHGREDLLDPFKPRRYCQQMKTLESDDDEPITLETINNVNKNNDISSFDDHDSSESMLRIVDDAFLYEETVPYEEKPSIDEPDKPIFEFVTLSSASDQAKIEQDALPPLPVVVKTDTEEISASNSSPLLQIIPNAIFNKDQLIPYWSNKKLIIVDNNNCMVKIPVTAEAGNDTQSSNFIHQNLSLKDYVQNFGPEDSIINIHIIEEPENLVESDCE